MGALVAIPVIMLVLGAISAFSTKLTSRIGRNSRKLIVIQVVMGIVVVLLVVFAFSRIASTH
ncbi:hypothetical protein ACQR5U_13175 [Xanthomonas oryzae pv. oryzicola]|uniref:hypothetical protein n=1 Tax=Xanthomonas oryzae TaxID=347 RepID=UPI00117D8FC4|nr:hypothetical protein [Xanthomonas oryzae]